MSDLIITSVTGPDGRRLDLAIREDRLIDPADAHQARVLDADGLVALPGLVDLHTHLRQPGNEAAETIASGTQAAAHGGYTCVFAMANTNPVPDNAERIASIRDLSSEAAAQVVPVGSLTKGLLGAEPSDIEAMHAVGVTYFSDDGKCVMDARVMRQIMDRVARVGGVAAQHCQDSHLAGPHGCLPSRFATPTPSLDPTDWPAVAESVIVARDVQLALDTGCHLHVCHVSTAESVEIIRWAKARGAAVTAEVTPHHLLLDSALVDGSTSLYKVNPPLRASEDREALISALADGTIDCVATDHAPHTPADKGKPFPEASPGMIGLEQSLAVVMDVVLRPGLLDWGGVAERMSCTPALIGQVSANQGRPLTPGEPATFVLIDPTRRSVVSPDTSVSRARNNPYAGLTLPDPVVATFWNGRVTYGTV